MVRYLRHASYVFFLFGLIALCLLLFSGDAAATPDSNNDHTQAVGVANSDVVIGSVSTTDDLEDYFKIYMENGEVLDFYLVMNSGTDLDLYLFDSSLFIVSQSSTDNIASGVFSEHVTINVATTGWHYLSVYAYSGESDYYLWVRSTAEWTVMVYMDGDNNLESQALADYLEMSAVGSSPDVNIVVQFDRFDGYAFNGLGWEYASYIDDTSYDNWTGAMRFRVGQGDTPVSGNAIDLMGEVDMGSDETLSDFIIWGLGSFPAHHNMLVLWDHGGGWHGVCVDDCTYPSTMLTPQDIRFAMETVDTAYPGFTFDVIGFDACIMSGLETYYELSSYTSYFVGSQINEPGMGWNYERSLARLVAAPALSAETLSCYIAGDYVDSYTLPIAPYPVQEVTASVIDASELADVALDLHELADEMTVQMSARHNYYQYCREMCQSYYGDYVDLMDWAWWVSDYAPSSQVRQYAYDLYYSASDAVVFSSYNDAEGGMDITWTLGLNLYYPDASGDYDANYGSALLLTLGTLYDNMLVDYYEKTATANDPIEIDYGLPATGPNVTSGDSIEFYVHASDSDPDVVFWFWYVDGVFQPSNTTLSMVLSTNDSMIGDHTVQVWVWDGLSWDSYSWDLTVLSKPDLMIFDFYLLDSDLGPIDNMTSGRPAYVLVQMMNQGGSEANNFTVNCYIDFVYFCHWDYTSVAAGTYRSLLSWSFPLSELGMHVVTFVLDSGGTVDESNESNNQYSWAIDVVPAKWTLLIYMDGDNNLEPYMVNNFLQMAQIGSDANVSVVVQFDRVGGYAPRACGRSR
ncbi:MAG: Clostripain family protein [Methanomassiliicoccales archaeon PtaB.Bin215]|nr:MAG: Clostripain family protein [Methanomassiliicoccales archaeon PtaB.Bin215]